MADIAATAKIIINADTAPAVHQLTKVVEANKKIGESAEKSGGAISKFIGGAVEGFGKFNLALGGVKSAFDLLNGAIDTAIDVGRREQMEKSLAPGVLDRFREATDKLISRQDVMRLTLKGMTGDFKLSRDEMQTTLQAAVALEQKGFGPAAEIADKLVDALAKGVNKLDDFGINLEKTGNHQKDVNAAMDKFHDLIRENPVNEETKSLVQLKDSLLEIGNAIAVVVAQAAKAITWIASEWKEYAPDLTGGTADNERQAVRVRAAEEAEQRYRNMMIRNGLSTRLSTEELGRTSWQKRETERVMREYEEKYGNVDYEAEAKGASKEAYRRPKGPAPTGPGGMRGGVIGSEGFRYATDTVGTKSTLDLTPPEMPGRFAASSQFLDESGNERKSTGRVYTELDTSAMDAVNFMKQLTDQTTMLGGAWGVFQGAFGSAVSAAIDGSESIGKAFAKASAAGLKSLAVEYAVRALGEGAFALSSLAFGDGKGAATHGLAALKFAAAAAAAGVGSHVLGSLAGGGGGGANAGAGAAGGGYASAGARGGGGGGGDTIIVNLGDGFYGNRQETADAVARGVRQATRQGSRQKFSASYSG